MNTPDLTQDRELVELAEVMREAHLAKMAERGYPVQLYNSEYLAIADAARTYCGSGYTLPEATEANAARLASELLVIHGKGAPGKPTWTAWVREAKDYLQALHAAFGEPEKPAPTPDCPSCGRELRAIDATAGICWRCRPWRDCPPKPPLPAEKPVRDAVSRDEQREYEQLVRELTIRLAAGSSSSVDVVTLAVDFADEYFEWRKMEREEFNRCKK